MRDVFQDSMPTDPEQGGFLALMDQEKIAAFLHIETLFHFNSIYVESAYRHQNAARTLLREAANRIPAGNSAIWLMNPAERGDALARALGGRELGTYTVFRKDV